MTKWTEGGVAAAVAQGRADPGRQGRPRQGSEYARPGSGFMPGYTDVQKAFQDAFTAQIQTETFDADAVVAATKAAIDTALASDASHPGDGAGSATGPVDRAGGRGRPASAPSRAAMRRGTRARGGARRLRLHRRADGCCSWCCRSARSSTPCTSASGTGTSGPVRSTSAGLANYAERAGRPDLPPGDPELDLLRRGLGAADDGVGLFLAVIVNQKIRGQTFFRAPSTSRPSPAPPRSRCCGSSSWRRTGCSTSVRAALGLEPAVRAVRLSARTRTGSATRTRR